MKKLIIGLLAALLLAGAGGYFLVLRPFQTETPFVAAGEKALATQELLFLAEANIRRAVFLEKWYLGTPILPQSEKASPETKLPKPKFRSLSQHLQALRLDPRGDLDALYFALYPAQDKGKKAILLIGRFPVEKVQTYLAQEVGATKLDIEGSQAFELQLKDQKSCRPSDSWVISVSPEWILASDADSAKILIPRLKNRADAAVDLSDWSRAKSWDVFGAWLRSPEQLGGAAPKSILQGVAKGASKELEDFQWGYLGAGIGVLPPQARLRLLINGKDSKKASEKVEGWKASVASSKSQWAGSLPSLAKLHDALSLSTRGTLITATATLDKKSAEDLKNLPQEAIAAIFSNFGFSRASAGGAGQAPAEVIDQNPQAFQAQIPEAGIPPFGPNEKKYGFEPDLVQGPFGLRVESIRLRETADPGLDLELKARAPLIPNIPVGFAGQAEKLTLTVESVMSVTGVELLQQEECGQNRNDEPTAFRKSLESFEAEKTLKLGPQAEDGKLKSVSGHFRVELPLKTESVLLSSPLDGKSIEKFGARFSIQSVKQGSLAFQVTGETGRILHIQALNAQKQPLSRQGGSSSGFLFGEGRSEQRDYQGQVEQVEVVFAVEEKSVRYPFTLTDFTLKGSESGFTGASPAPFRSYTYADLVREFSEPVKKGRKKGPPPPIVWRPLPPSVSKSQEPPLARAQLEPFELTWKGIRDFSSMRKQVDLDMEIRGPNIGAFADALAIAEFDLQEVLLKDGQKVQKPQKSATPETNSFFRENWDRLLSLRRWSSTPNALSEQFQLLVGTQSKADDVQALRGALKIHFPKKLETVKVEEFAVGKVLEASGFLIRITERGRGKVAFKLRSQNPELAAPRVLAVRFHDSKGKFVMSHFPDLEKEPDGSLILKVSPLSQFTRVEFVIATEVETKAYPVELVRGR